MDISTLRNTELSDRELLERALFALARAREDAEELKEMRDDAREAMLQTVEGQEYLALKEERGEARDAAREFKKMAGDLAVDLFDGEDKHVVPGANIAVYTDFVLHEDEAIRWAVDNGHSILLRPDTNGFKNLLDRLPDDIYEIVEEPRARISRKDLSEMYPPDPAPEASVTEEAAPAKAASSSADDDYDIPF